MEKVILEEQLALINEQILIVARQIENSDRNITGLITQKTRHMDRRDILEARKADIEAQLALLEPTPE
jgi:hypothetical protein